VPQELPRHGVLYFNTSKKEREKKRKEKAPKLPKSRKPL
jgi:hypothetical protein